MRVRGLEDYGQAMPVNRDLYDEFTGLLYRKRGIEMEAINFVRDASAINMAPNNIYVVIAPDALEQYGMFEIPDGAFVEDFMKFSFCSGFLKDETGVNGYVGVVVDKVSNIAVMFFNGRLNKTAVCFFVSAQTISFRHIFNRSPVESTRYSEGELDVFLGIMLTYRNSPRNTGRAELLMTDYVRGG